MHHPIIIKPVRQHTHYTCAVAALSMLIGRDYSEVYDYAHRIIGERIKTGLYTRDMRAVAKHFGCALTSLRRFDVDEATGLLILGQAKHQSDHAVLLFHGVIYDPMDGQLWEPEAFLASYGPTRKARFRVLLVVAGS